MTRFRSVILLALMVLATAAFSFGQVAISVRIGPPVLPVYAQPICPAPGYIWIPGYWAWSPDADSYYWVPGTWALAPQPGYLWTPGYWAFSSGFYGWHPGYWGLTVGFYGGINYGFGYPGNGYYGGYWRGNNYYYNRTVNNVNVTNITNVYNQPVANNVSGTRVAYNGGPGGVQARPTPAQISAERGRHIAATSAQVKHEQAARADRAQLASVNHGRPAVVATPKPGAMNDRAATRTNPAAVNRPAPSQQANGVPHPPQNNQPARNNNVPHPNNNAQVPYPPANNGARPVTPNNTAHQQAPQPQAAPAPHPNTANNRPAPHPAQSERSAPAPRPVPQPQQQARQANHPPQPAPQQHAAAHPPAPRPMEAPHPQAQAPRPQTPRPAAPPQQRAAPREEERPR